MLLSSLDPSSFAKKIVIQTIKITKRAQMPVH